MSIDNKVLQFEIWNECNNGCLFCFNKYVYRTTVEEKIQTLNLIYSKLTDDEFIKNYNKVAFIGGEFFQGQLNNKSVRKLFFKLIEQIDKLLNANIINGFWVTATLISKNQDDLFEMLNSIRKKECIWICTSYDTYGRFHTLDAENAWHDNILKIKDISNKIFVNSTTILTGQFIDKYINGEFNIDAFQTYNQCSWYSKPPLLPDSCCLTKKQYNDKIIQNFFPTRHRFLEFLLKFKLSESEFEYDKLFNTQFRSDVFIKTADKGRSILVRDKIVETEQIANSNSCADLRNFNDIQLKRQKTCANCNHSAEYALYVDSDECFLCDKKRIKALS